jgi:hypothetical protein
VFVVGKITWVPPPNGIAWYIGAAVVAIAVYLGTRSRRQAVWMAGAVATIVAVDTLNAAGGVAFSTSGVAAIAGTLLTRDLLSTVAWICGLVALIDLRQNPRQSVLPAGLTAWILTITSGVTDIGVFTRSVIPSKLDPDITRLYTALTIGIGVGLSAMAVMALWADRSQLVRSGKPKTSSSRAGPSTRRRNQRASNATRR